MKPQRSGRCKAETVSDLWLKLYLPQGSQADHHLKHMSDLEGNLGGQLVPPISGFSEKQNK